MQKNELVTYTDRESLVVADVFGFFCTTKNFCLSGEIKPVTVGARVYYYNSKKFKLHVNKNNCMQDDFHPFNTIQ